MIRCLFQSRSLSVVRESSTAKCARFLLAFGSLIALTTMIGGCGTGHGTTTPPPTFTIARTSNPPDAIVGHAYSVYIGTSLAAGNAASDVVTACSLTGSAPAGMTAAPGTLPGSGASAYYCALTISSASAPGQYNFTLQAADSSTPPQTNSHSYALTIRPDFTFTTPTLAQGVQGRTYGVAPLSQPDATNIGTTQGGITVGNGPLTACSLASVTPSNPGLTVALDATKTQCFLSSTSLTTAGTFAVTVSAAETQITDSVTGALAVPAASANPVTSVLQLVANPPFTLAVNQGSSWASAVTNRPYGSGAGCTGGACVPPIYTATGGLGGYAFPATTPATMPAGMACSAVSGSATYTCSAPAPGITAAPGTYNPSVTVSDTGNTAAPSGSQSLSSAISVNAEMTLAPPSSPFADAVLGRHYGVPTDSCASSLACTPLTYTVPAATPGLGGYTFAPNNFPSGFACVTSSNNGNCSDSTSVGGAGGTFNNLNVTVADTANASTPGNSVTSTNGALTVRPEMTLAAPTSPFPDAVLGRHYGVTTDICAGSLACAALTYTVSAATPGLGGPYTFTVNNFPAGFACATSSNNGNCSDNTLVGGAAGTFNNLSATVKDTANVSTPQGAVTSTSGTLTVHPEMAITRPSTVPPAVVGRRYGTGAGCAGGNCTPLTYTVPAATPGLGGYTFASTNFPSGFACVTSSNSTNCSDASVGGSAGTLSNLNVTVKDTANQATPQGAVTSSPNTTLTVNSEITLTPPSSPFADAVLGRHYGTGAGCSGGNCTPLVYTVPAATPGLGSYTFTPNNFPAGFACPISTNNGNCADSTSVGGAAGTFNNLNVTVADTANAATPGNSVTSTNGTLTVRPEMNFTATPPSPLADAVNGRTYGQGSACGMLGTSACAPLTYTIQAGSGLGAYSFAFILNSGNGGFACTAGGSSSNCTSGVVTSAAGTYNSVHASVTDTANGATPSNTIASSNGTLTVHPEMNFTATPTSPLNDAVNGRTYGQGSTCGPLGTSACAPLTYTIQAGSGLGAYSFAFILNGGNGGFACTAGGTGSSCSSSNVTGTAGIYSGVHAAVTDTANSSTPNNTIPSASGTMTVHSELTLTPPSSIETAVTGRTYGQGSTCGAAGTTACATLNYAVANGLGTYRSPAAMTTTAGTFTCPLSGATYQCSSANITGSGVPSLSLTASEIGNASTPGNSKSDSTKSLTINPEMNFTATPTSPLFDAVNGRTYGQGSTCGMLGTSACAPLTYTIQAGSGLGGYSFQLNVSGGLGGFTCSTGGSSSNCTSAAVTSTAGTYNSVHASVTDTANGATPSNTIASSNATLTVHPEMTVTPPAAVAMAVHGRAYGRGAGCSGGACQPLQYTVSNGLGNYTLTGSSLTTPSDTFACTLTSPAFLCSNAAIAGAGGTNPTLTFAGSETANASTPGNTKTDTSKTLTVRGQLSVNPPSPSPITDAVSGRPYGTPSGSQDLIYSLPSGQGLPTVTLAGLGFPSPIFCTTVNNATDSLISMHCNSSGVGVAGATATGTVRATDTANASTPAATLASDPGSQLSSTATTQITVDPELVIANQNLVTPACGTPNPPCALPNGQKNQPYSVVFTCQAPLGTGTCAGTGSPGNAAAQYTWTTVGSNNITGTSFTTTMPVSNPTGDATFAGTPTAAGSSETVTIAVADNGNITTPSCTAAATCPSANFTAQILSSAAYVGASGSNTVGLFDTSAGVGSVAEIGTGITLGIAGTTPNYVAASPNGTFVFIADPTHHQVFLRNTLTGATTTVSTGLAAAARDTHAITAVPKVVPTAGVSPDAIDVVVANAAADNLQVINANPLSGNFGMVTNVHLFTLGGSHLGSGPVDLKMGSTFLVGGTRLTHGYVVREGGDEVCVFDAEPSSVNVGNEIAAAHSPNSEQCIGLYSAVGVPKFIDVSPDGLYAFVTVTNGMTNGYLKIIDINPNSATFETLLTTIDLTTLTSPCPVPEGVRVSPDGQTVWVACEDSSHQLLPFETALVNMTQFAAGTPITTANSTDAPLGIAFRSDGAFGLATLSTATPNSILPFTTTAGAPVPTTGVTTPSGIDHIPNAVLHIVTSTLPAATHSVAYASSIVANGPNKYFTFTDVTAGPNNLANLGFTLSSNGQVTSTNATSIVNAPGTYALTIQVTDQSRPVNNLVLKTISLTIN